MGSMMNGCVCSGKDCNCINCMNSAREEEEKNQDTDNEDEEPLIQAKSLEDVKLETENFVIQRTKSILNVYEKVSILGKSEFSEVYKVHKKGSKNYRVIKEINKSSLNDTQDVLNEIEILKKLDHFNIVRIYEYCDDKDMVYLVEDYYEGGDLTDKMDNYGVFCEFLVKYLMYNIFIAVNYLHSNNVVHGDIKREHILLSFHNKDNENNDKIFKKLSENENIQNELQSAASFDELSDEAKKIASEIAGIEVLVLDFGSAKIKKRTKIDEKFTGVVSNTFYCSPEVVIGKYDSSCDEWSCGVLMYILLTDIAPFRGKEESEILTNIIEKEVDFDIDELKHITPQCKDLITRLLEKDPEKRIKACDALKHDFFTKGVDIRKLMERGNETINRKRLSTFALKTTFSRSQGSKKGYFFKNAIMAYMALNFTDKEESTHIKGIFRELAGNDPKFEISKETFITKMQELFKGDYNQKQLSDMFDTLDNNQNGTIEFEELNRGLSDQTKLINEKNIRETFKFFDKNKNGKISLKEITDVVFHGKIIPPYLIKECLDDIGLKDENDEMSLELFADILGYKEYIN